MCIICPLNSEVIISYLKVKIKEFLWRSAITQLPSSFDWDISCYM